MTSSDLFSLLLHHVLSYAQTDSSRAVAGSAAMRFGNERGRGWRMERRRPAAPRAASGPAERHQPSLPAEWSATVATATGEQRQAREAFVALVADVLSVNPLQMSSPVGLHQPGRKAAVCLDAIRFHRAETHHSLAGVILPLRSRLCFSSLRFHNNILKTTRQ